MKHVWGLFVTLLILVISAGAAAPGAAAPEGRADAPAGQMTWAVHFVLAPTWFDQPKPPGSSRRSWCCMRCTTPW